LSGRAPQWQLLDPAGDPHKGLKLIFLNGMPCRNGSFIYNRHFELVLPCNNQNPDRTFQVLQEDNIFCKFTFQLASRYSCPLSIPRLPNPLPTNYRGLLEYTITSQNETFWIHEIHDQAANRVRWDQYNHPGGIQTTLFAYDLRTSFVVTNRTHCRARPMSPSEHINSVFDLLHDHQKLLNYAGSEVHRGIHCDVWEGGWTFYSDRDKTWIREFARWYFAKPEWKVIENPNVFRRPVAVLIASNRTHPALLGFDEHYISFIDFNDRLDGFALRQVQLEWQWNCPGGPPRPDFNGNSIHQDVMSSGGAAGLSIFFLVLGGAIGFGGHWYQSKKGGYGEIQDH